MESPALESLGRDDLILHARRLGVAKPELLTRVELKDEIVRLSESDERRRSQLRGWLGVARDLIADIVEQGLHLPDAAALIRGEVRVTASPTPPRAVATVTLAEIYAAQGHLQRALGILDELLANEPEHEVAQALRERLLAERDHRDVPVTDTAEVEAHDTLPPGAEETPLAEPEPEPELEAEPRLARDNGVHAVAAPKPTNDTCALIAERNRAYLYWELVPETFERMRTLRSDGAWTIRVVGMTPSWDGAVRVERTLIPESHRGAAFVDGIGDAAVVRAAIGWQSASRFEPVIVASELGLDADERAVVRWSPPGAADRLQPGAVGLQRAVDEYRALCSRSAS
jgi:hypothetical protein